MITVHLTENEVKQLVYDLKGALERMEKPKS
jgi:hypothetical protein